LWQKFLVKLFRNFHVCHPQIDMIEATRFHLVILDCIASQFNCLRSTKQSAVVCAPIAIGRTSESTECRARTPRENRARSYSVTKRAKIGLSFSIVAFGHNFESVTSAVSNAKWSGQLGSLGIRGVASTITLCAVSAFASKWLRTMSADTGSSST